MEKNAALVNDIASLPSSLIDADLAILALICVILAMISSRMKEEKELGHLFMTKIRPCVWAKTSLEYQIVNMAKNWWGTYYFYFNIYQAVGQINGKAWKTVQRKISMCMKVLYCILHLFYFVVV